MRKHALRRAAVIVMLSAITGITPAQDRPNVVKTNVIGIIGHQYQLGFERALNERMSVQLSGGLISFKSSQTMFSSSYESKTTGFILIPEFRLYLTSGKWDAPRGAYLAPLARLRMVTEDLDDTTTPMDVDVSRVDNTTTIGGGLVIGYQALIGDVLALDVFIGPQFKSRSTVREYGNPAVTDDDFSSKFLDFKVTEKNGMGLRFGINLGVAF